MLAYVVRRSRLRLRDPARRPAAALRALLPLRHAGARWRAAPWARRRRPRCSSSGSRTTATTSRSSGTPSGPFDTLLVEHFRRTLTFDFGRSDADGTPIVQRLREGDGPEPRARRPVVRARPAVLGRARRSSSPIFRETYIDRMGVILCVLAMSISTLLYIIGGQFLIGKLLRWFPISGFDPSPAVIVALPDAAADREPGQRARRQRALLPHGLHRGGRARLRAHRAREGLRRPARDDAPRAAQRPDPDPDAHRGGDPVPVHRLAPARVVLRDPRPRLADRRRDATATTSRRCARWSSSARCSSSARRSRRT